MHKVQSRHFLMSKKIINFSKVSTIILHLPLSQSWSWLLGMVYGIDVNGMTTNWSLNVYVVRVHKVLHNFVGHNEAESFLLKIAFTIYKKAYLLTRFHEFIFHDCVITATGNFLKKVTTGIRIDFVLMCRGIQHQLPRNFMS